MNEEPRTKHEEPIATVIERPETNDPRIVRVAVRFCRLAAEEGLTPYEASVAWQRIARTILREAVWPVATGSLIATLARELIAEVGGQKSEVGGRMSDGSRGSGSLTSDLCPLTSEKGGAA